MSRIDKSTVTERRSLVVYVWRIKRRWLKETVFLLGMMKIFYNLRTTLVVSVFQCRRWGFDPESEN